MRIYETQQEMNYPSQGDLLDPSRLPRIPGEEVYTVFEGADKTIDRAGSENCIG